MLGLLRYSSENKVYVIFLTLTPNLLSILFLLARKGTEAVNSDMCASYLVS